MTFDSKFVLTDPGCVQEKTAFLKITGITIRGNTEEFVTITGETKELTGADATKVFETVDDIFGGSTKRRGIPDLLNGLSASCIAKILGELRA